MDTFGSLVKAARQRVGLTQANLASRLDVQQQAVNRWEADKDRPTPEKVRLLTGILDLDPLGVCVALGYVDPKMLGDREIRVDTRAAIEADDRLDDTGRRVLVAAYDAAAAPARAHLRVAQKRRPSRGSPPVEPG